jgi:pimeloyl-ACP methyl ester carboxylesterase
MRELTVERDEVWRLAAGLRVPTLVLHGEHDRVVGVEIGRHAADVIPNAELVVLDAGHTPQMEVPGEFVSAVSAFVDRALSVSTTSRSSRG